MSADPRGLSYSIDGTPSVKIDLAKNSQGLSVSLDGTPWTGYSPTVRTISIAGGNWTDATTWMEGIVPVAGDDIRATSESGNLIVNTTTANLNSIDLTNYAGTMSGSGSITVIGTASSTTNALFSSGMTSTWTGVLNLNPVSGAIINLTSNNKLSICTGITISNTVNLLDSFTVSGSITVSGNSTLKLTSGITINCASIKTASDINVTTPVTISSITAGSSATIAITTVSDLYFCTIQDLTISGNIKTYAHYSTSTSNNTGITFLSYKTISITGGNWSTTGAWVEGTVPTSTDEILALSNSGNLVVDTAASGIGIDLYAYTGTLSGSSSITLSGYSTSTDIARFGGTVTWARVLNLNPPSGGAINLTSSSKLSTCTGITQNGAGTLSLQDALTLNTSNGQITFTQGTFNTNNNAVTNYNVVINGTLSKTLNFGTTLFTLTGGWSDGSSNLTLNASDSTIKFTNGANVTFAANGKTYGSIDCTTNAGFVSLATSHNLICANFNYSLNSGSGGNTQLYLGGNLTVTGTLTFAGYNSNTKRIIIQSGTIGTPRTITCSGTYNISNADFQDISWSTPVDFSAIAGLSGDCGGNTNITFTTSQTQNWTNTNGGSWSASGNWSNRVPLPQDDVVFDCVFGTSKTITADMPRLGRNIDFSGATYTTNLTLDISSVACSIYGSLNLTGLLSKNITKIITFAGRGAYTLTSNGKTLFGIYLQAPNGSLTLNDALTCTYNLMLYYGTFYNTGNYSVTVKGFCLQSTITTTQVLGDANWTITGTGGDWLFSIQVTNKDIISSSNTNLYFTGVPLSYTMNVELNICSYGDIYITPGGTYSLVFSGAFTCKNLRRTSSGIKSVKFTKSTTYILTGSDFFKPYDSSDTNIWTISSNTSGSTFTLSKTSGVLATDYISLQDSTASGGATFYAGHNSTNVSGNTGWIFASYYTSDLVASITANAISSSAAQYARNAAAALGILASSSRALASKRAVAASISTITNANKIISMKKSVSASISVATLVSKTASFLKSCTQSISVSSSCSKVMSFVRTCTSSITVTTVMEFVADIHQRMKRVLRFNRLFGRWIGPD